MLTVLIGIVAFVALFASANNGEWGSFWIGVVILVVLILMAAGERRDTRAYLNCRDYWADGGPRRREARATEHIHIENRYVIVPEQTRSKDTEVPRMEVQHVCPKCRRMVRAWGDRIYTNEGYMVRYICPICKSENMTKFGF